MDSNLKYPACNLQGQQKSTEAQHKNLLIFHHHRYLVQYGHDSKMQNLQDNVYVWTYIYNE